MQPLPPSPALTRMVAWSMNTAQLSCNKNAARCRTGFSPSGAAKGRAEARPTLLFSGDRRDADVASALALVLEVDDPVDLGEERVIAADADVLAGIELRAALSDDDRSTGHELAGEALDAEHFRLRVAAVARRTLSLFMSHDGSPRCGARPDPDGGHASASCGSCDASS